MDRLTYKSRLGGVSRWLVHEADNLICNDVCDRHDCECSKCPIQNAIDRLAAYEDTGLTPEEIQEAVALLNEHKKAEARWLLMVPPCDVGDSIYTLDYKIKEVVEHPIKCFELWSDGTAYLISNASRLFPVESAGITYYITYEEAEAALKGDDNK